MIGVARFSEKVVQKVVQKTVEYLLSSQSYNELLLEKVPDKKEQVNV